MFGHVMSVFWRSLPRRCVDHNAVSQWSTLLCRWESFIMLMLLMLLIGPPPHSSSGTDRHPSPRPVLYHVSWVGELVWWGGAELNFVTLNSNKSNCFSEGLSGSGFLWLKNEIIFNTFAAAFPIEAVWEACHETRDFFTSHSCNYLKCHVSVNSPVILNVCT